MVAKFRQRVSWLVLLVLFAKVGFCEELRRVPDEIESPGGHALGFGNAAVAALSDLASVRANPAMIAFDKQYTVSGAYHWPTLGRDFYQVGAVDSQTSPIAAGLLYTGVTEPYGRVDPSSQDELQSEQALAGYYDSPIHHRVNVAVAKSYNFFSLGLGVNYVSGYYLPKTDEEQSDVLVNRKGTSFALGAAGLLTKQLRLAVSVENLANRQIVDIAPNFTRVGLAYILFEGDFTFHADYQRRQRVWQEKHSLYQLEDDLVKVSNYEQMFTPSVSFRIQNLLRVFGAYGQELAGSSRQSISGGIAVVNDAMSLSYLISKPYLSDPEIHQALNLSLQIAI